MIHKETLWRSPGDNEMDLSETFQKDIYDCYERIYGPVDDVKDVALKSSTIPAFSMDRSSIPLNLMSFRMKLCNMMWMVIGPTTLRTDVSVRKDLRFS